MSEERQEYRMGVGAASILMIFVVLCMTTLAVLSFSSARAELTLTLRRQNFVEAYGQALASAERTLAQIDAELLQAQAEPDTFAERVRSLAIEGVHIQVTEELRVSFAIDFGEAQVLEVAVQVNAPGSERRFERVACFFRNTGVWMPENAWLLN